MSEGLHSLGGRVPGLDPNAVLAVGAVAVRSATELVVLDCEADGLGHGHELGVVPCGVLTVEPDQAHTCLSQHQPETPLRAVSALSKQLWPLSEQLPKSVNGDRSCVATSLHRLSSVKRSIAMYNIASKVVELFQRSLPSSAVPRIVLKQPRKRCGNPQRWFTIS